MKNLFYNWILIGSLILGRVSASEQSVEEEMKEKIHSLGEGRSFSYIDLRLSDRELDIIDQLKFDKVPATVQINYDRYGDLHLLVDELPDFLKSIGNNDEVVIKTTTEAIFKTVQSVVRASGKNSAWVSVRSFTPNTDSFIPRWHIDGHYYGPNPYPGLMFKFAATLKGPSTLLYNLPDEQREIFVAHWNDRTFLSELLDITKAESAKRGEGVFFIVNDDKRSAVHSEPKIHENRLFFSVLIGDRSEIEELYSKSHH